MHNMQVNAKSVSFINILTILHEIRKKNLKIFLSFDGFCLKKIIKGKRIN